MVSDQMVGHNEWVLLCVTCIHLWKGCISKVIHLCYILFTSQSHQVVLLFCYWGLGIFVWLENISLGIWALMVGCIFIFLLFHFHSQINGRPMATKGGHNSGLWPLYINLWLQIPFHCAFVYKRLELNIHLKNSNNYSIGNHFFKVLVQIHYSQVKYL